MTTTGTDPLAHALGLIAAGESLTSSETSAALGVIMAGEATAGSIGAFLLGLRSRGETAAEVAGAAVALRLAMRTVDLPDSGGLVDTCGTGGGTVRTVNISTAAALVAAGAGVPIAKHGNRSFTSRSGSADVLEAMGVAIDVSPGSIPGIMARSGIAFMYAPSFHPAMRHVGPVRRELAIPTIMNLVGPLANPARVSRQVLGVAEAKHGRLMAEALARLGSRHALVVYGRIGIDEISPVGISDVWQVKKGEIDEFRLDPADYSLAAVDMTGTEGGEPAENALAIESLLEFPEDAPLSLRSAVLLNAAAAIVVADQAEGFTEAVDRARESLSSGAAAARLEELRAASPFRTS